MSESFEAHLIAAASKEVFKKAKQIVRGGEVLCCHESSPGVLRAICRDSDGFISRAELRGFPNGPFTGTCSCNGDFHGFCPHAMAAALYHAKYTIKYTGEEILPDIPARYSGLRSSDLPHLLNELLEPHAASVEINAENEFPHVPGLWGRAEFTVTLRSGTKTYCATTNKLRQLYFEKKLAVALKLEDFPLQDRQIIRFLAVNSRQDAENVLSLDSEQCAEFFHCLAGFSKFTCLKKKIVVHSNPATPVLLLERTQSGYVLKSAIVCEGAPLPLEDVKVITGRNGCWLGMQGEYWWIPALCDVSWLRNFLRTTIQPCDLKTAKMLYSMRDKLPLKIIASRGVKVRQHSFKTLYDAFLLPDGCLAMEVLFDYGHRLCKADQGRFISCDGTFLRRDEQGEFEIIRELLNFGFREQTGDDKIKSGTRMFLLRDREAIGMFVDEVVPRWLREKRDCLLSSHLAALCGDSGNLKIDCKVAASTESTFDIAVSLTAAGVPVRWRELTDAAGRNEFFMTPSSVPGTLVKIPHALRLLAASFRTVAAPLPDSPDFPERDMLRLPRLAACSWAETGAGISGAVPVEFLRMKVDFDTLRLEPSEKDIFANGVFTGELRPYQKAGVCWLLGMAQRYCNPILADEMGLGKTIQSIALLAADTENNLPALVIAPTSLTDNWWREIIRFAPGLRTVKIAGHNRGPLWTAAKTCDVCICSYALAKRDVKQLSGFHFKYLILDEAQHIKNPASINAQTCKMISAEHKLVLTGTPLENSAEDLWSIFDFLHPGFLGKLNTFRERFAEIDRNCELGKELSRMIAPLILRRKKADVCLELPEKQEQELYCDMEPDQLELYRNYEEAAREHCRNLHNGGNGMEMLTALLRLRQICCNPSLLPDDIGDSVSSAKFELLCEVLSECLDSGRKILIFSQFTSMLKKIRNYLDEIGVRCEYLDGSTKDRMEHVDAFNHSPDIPVFLLSLKAGGVGLNLTAADTVILYDPWWNPAVEAQAMDRAHRIGQTKNVSCIKLFVRGTVEEKVLSLQRTKQELFGALVEDSSAMFSGMTTEDFEFLLDIHKPGL